jgi:hypothetical protein
MAAFYGGGQIRRAWVDGGGTHECRTNEGGHDRILDGDDADDDDEKEGGEIVVLGSKLGLLLLCLARDLNRCGRR